MLRSFSIFGLSEPARTYLRHKQSKQFNCAHTLAPDLGTGPYKATAALAPPVQLSPNPSLLAAQLARAYGYFCRKNQTGLIYTTFRNASTLARQQRFAGKQSAAA